MQHLELSDNEIGGFLPNLLFNSAIQSINVNNNVINGTIPDDFFTNGFHIKELRAKGNNFSGEIPANIGSAAPSLTVLDLSNNNLIGPVPSSLAEDSMNIGMINLSSNNLTSLPDIDSWSGKSISIFSMSDNLLTGTFPDLSSHSDLTILLLNDNLLSGTLPSMEDGSYSNLRMLNVSNNAFSGSIDNKWVLNTTIFGNPVRVTGGILMHFLDVSYNNLTNVNGEFVDLVQSRSENHIQLRMTGNPICSTVNFAGIMTNETQPLDDPQALNIVECIPLCVNDTSVDETPCVSPKEAMEFYRLNAISSETSGNSSGLIITLSVLGGILLTVIISAMFVYVLQRYRKRAAVKQIVEEEVTKV